MRLHDRRAHTDDLHGTRFPWSKGPALILTSESHRWGEGPTKTPSRERERADCRVVVPAGIHSLALAARRGEVCVRRRRVSAFHSLREGESARIGRIVIS